MLAAQVQSRDIGGVTYHVLPLPAGMSLKVMTRVLKMAAPAFGDVSSLREAASAVGAMLSGLLTELDEGTIALVAEEFAKVTQWEIDGKKLPLGQTFDEHFRGRFVEMMEWLRFAAEVTYGPLGERLKAALAKPAAPAAG